MWQDILQLLCVCVCVLEKVYLSARQTGQLRENFRRGSICGFGKVASLEQGSVQRLQHRAQAAREKIGSLFRLQAPVMVFLPSATTRGRHIP